MHFHFCSFSISIIVRAGGRKCVCACVCVLVKGVCVRVGGCGGQKSGVNEHMDVWYN